MAYQRKCLQLAKCLKYLGHTILCDYAFGAFMVTWFFTRHIAYNLVVYSVWRDSLTIIGSGCFEEVGENMREIDAPSSPMVFLEPFHNRTGIVCYTPAVKWAFLCALISLQVITLGWFVLIVQVAIKVLKGNGAEDNRSDDEAEEEEFEYEEAEPLEEEVGVEDIDLEAWERRSGVKRQASTTGVSLPGHSDRKELLGRIGCEKQVD